MKEQGQSVNSIFSPLDGEIQDDAFYADLGFKSGLEVHQQLLTEKKLFCHCPAGKYVKEHDASILRHMRPTLSELGEYDGTALMEFKTKKDIVYLLSRENVCTYEMDDTPPFMMNRQALHIALEISYLMNCQKVDEIHVVRKQYLDGSIPTGFQRTAIIGGRGQIPFRDKTIGITQISIEEDSCREVSDEGHRILFRTDRLSMPLTETVTDADMKTPQEVAEVCELIGSVARVTGKVRRGIGAARQDVNVSVEGGRRVEIKGVSRISMIPRLVHNEALRQRRLLDIKDHLIKLGLNPENIRGGSAGITDLLQNTSSPLLREAIQQGALAKAFVIRGARKVMKAWVQPGLAFPQELSGRIRVIACLDQPMNLFVRDEEVGFGMARHDLLPSEVSPWVGPSEFEWSKIVSRVRASEEDAIVIVWGSEKDTQTALNEIQDRMVEALEGVPHETRMPLENGNTDFERVLPGPNRMYPDTDLPPIALSKEETQEIEAHLPLTPWKREEALSHLSLPDQWLPAMVISPHFDLFLELMKTPEAQQSAKIVAWGLLEVLTSLRRKGIPADGLGKEDLRLVFGLVVEGKFHREGLPWLLERLALLRSKGVPAEQDHLHSKQRLEAILMEEFPELVQGKVPLKIGDEEISRLCGERDQPFYAEEKKRVDALMRPLMKRFQGLVKGGDVLRAVKEYCQRHPQQTSGDNVISLKRKEG